ILGLWRWTRPPVDQAVTFESYKLYYTLCVLATLFLIPITLTVLVAVGYHDTSIQALLRDELQLGRDDVEYRYRQIARDIRRFAAATPVALPDAWQLTKLVPAPGYVRLPDPPATTAAHPSATQPRGRRGWQNPEGWQLATVEPGLWIRRCGPPTL